jgi:subtilase family serine protease
VEKFAPDYVITDKHEDWVDPADPSKGYKVHYTVTNQGNANATQSSDTCLFIDLANVDSQPCPALAVGDTYSDTFDGNFTCTADPDDNVTVCADWGASCDGSGVITESNENNNCNSNIWSCYVAGPNLVVIHKEENWQDRDTYKVLYTVTNEGDESAGVSRTCVYIDENGNGVPDAGELVGKNLTYHYCLRRLRR